MNNLSNKLFGIIYEAKNIENNKRYIGKTTISLEHRKKAHLKNVFYENRKSRFYNALALYGSEKFKWRVIGQCYSELELNNSEKECIKFFQTQNKLYGYNISDGGDGISRGNIPWNKGLKTGKLSNEHRLKIKKAHVGKHTGNQNIMFGKNVNDLMINKYGKTLGYEKIIAKNKAISNAKRKSVDECLIINLYNEGASLKHIKSIVKVSYVKEILIKNGIAIRTKQESKQLEILHRKTNGWNKRSRSDV